MDDASVKDQKSAAALSLWHCILSWFFMNAEDHYLKPDNSSNRSKVDYEAVMVELFKDMRKLRAIIHIGAENNETGDTDKVDDDPVEINNPYKVIVEVKNKVDIIVKQVVPERWTEEISSMMREFMAMHRVLKEHTKSRRASRRSKNFSLISNSSGRHLACILTIWYWLAAWSAKLDDELAEKSRQEFLKAVDTKSSMLAQKLFTSRSSKKETKELKDMMSALHNMVNSNLQHWVEVLEHFTETMREAGSVRAHTKATIDAATKTMDMVHEHASGTSGMIVHPKIIRPVTSSPLGGLFKNSVINSQLPVLQIVDELKEPIGKCIVHIPEVANHLISSADHLIKGTENVAEGAIGTVNRVIDGVESAAKTVYGDVKGAIETVHDDVAHLVHGIGEGIQNFAHSVSSWFSHIF